MDGKSTAEATEAARELIARNRIITAVKTRNPHAPAKPTGVFLKSPTTGVQQMIYNDGSVRNEYQRRPGLSGRQFRKLRKTVNKRVRAKEAVDAPRQES